jgi:hypothetical protein
LSFWLFRLLKLWRGNLLGCMTISYFLRHSPPTILVLHNLFSFYHIWCISPCEFDSDHTL